MSQKPQLPEFDFSFCSDKSRVFKNYCKYIFTRTQSMFVYTGLPETIPAAWLENYLQRAGSCIIAKHNGNLYALIGNVSGERDAYYQPTKYIVANPWLKLSKEYTIGEDCVYCRNDYDAIGLTPLVSRYCGMLTENLLTIRLTDINMRMMNLLSAVDDDTLLSTRQYLKDLEEGKLGTIAEDGFFDGIKLQGNNAGKSDYVVQFIELHQYLKASLYNELGLNANYNMKREAINGNEASLNDDALMPLIDDMLKQRRIMCEEINEMFDLDVSVEFGSSWQSNVAEKSLYSEAGLGATPEEQAAIAGDEKNLDDNSSNDGGGGGDDVSRLKGNEVNDNYDKREAKEAGSESERPDEDGKADRETESKESAESTGDSKSEDTVYEEKSDGDGVTVVVEVDFDKGDDDDVSRLKDSEPDDSKADDSKADDSKADDSKDNDSESKNDEPEPKGEGIGQSEEKSGEDVSRLKDEDTDTDEDSEVKKNG